MSTGGTMTQLQYLEEKDKAAKAEKSNRDKIALIARNKLNLFQNTSELFKPIIEQQTSTTKVLEQINQPPDIVNYHLPQMILLRNVLESTDNDDDIFGIQYLESRRWRGNIWHFSLLDKIIDIGGIYNEGHI